MALSAIAVAPIASDRHGSITNRRTHVPRLCCFHRDDLRRASASPQINRGTYWVPFFMNYDKVKLIAHNLKLLAASLEDAIKEDPDKYLQQTDEKRFGYRFDDDDDGYAD